MTTPEVCKEVATKIFPQLQELGFEAMVLMGYATDGDGKTIKITISAAGKNPAYIDALTPIHKIADAWGKGEL